MYKVELRRYGFHGLSYEYISRRLASELPALAQGCVIVAHLGAGASLCALDKGVSIATTFGISVLDGLMMATRCGSLNPGVILYLGRLGHSLAEIEDMLYNRSGLLGVSGISGDIRVLLASDAPHAREAIELFTYRIALEVGAMTSALGGIDGIVFTAGIGQHAPKIRAAVCERLSWLGVRLDQAANDEGAFRISTPDSQVDVRVMVTDEEAMIAQHVLTMTSGPDPAVRSSRQHSWICVLKALEHGGQAIWRSCQTNAKRSLRVSRPQRCAAVSLQATATRPRRPSGGA